ncbi:MAG: hypothetical protein LBV73_07955 [Paraburkholderia sp.]|jgi:hypothetical protein|nr:hypothetical protein [Paraburkholderia sp.]
MPAEKLEAKNSLVIQKNEDGNHVLAGGNLHASSSQNGTAITLDPQPIKLLVDTPTDWPMVLSTAGVGAGSALIALVVGVLAYRAQKRQVQSATANIRKEWQGQLRDAISKFVGTVTYIGEELDTNPKFRAAVESRRAYREMVEAQALVHLLLDPRKDSSKKIVKLTRDLVDETWDRDRNELSNLLRELIAESIAVLEQAWEDIKNDLNGTMENS